VRRRWLLELVLLAALWGASFFFMRVAAPEFGPVPLIGVRVAVAAAVLAPVFLSARVRGSEGGFRLLRGGASHVVVLGVVNSALPFCLFAFATLSVTSGMAAILNATAPFFTAFVARVWLRERLSPPRVAGLVIGFAGVVVLVWKVASFRSGGAGWAVAAGLGGSFCYGVAANYVKRHASATHPLALAAGSQVAAAALLLPATLWSLSRAAAPPSARAWVMAVALGVLCTAVAYVLYFRLIAAAGPTGAITVTFLIPVFAMVWGFVFLGEGVTPRMIAGMVLVLAGTGLTTGLIRFPRASPLPVTG